MKYRSSIAKLFLAIVVVTISPALVAQTATPAVNFAQGTLVAPSGAATFYGPSTTSTNATGATQRPVEVRELANGLGASKVIAGQLSASAYSDRVFQYVNTNIDTVFMYGLQKGALGAVLDQAGTPFDQAHLFVELLREAGNIPAIYVSGDITLTPAQFQAWTGITNAVAACRLLADGGIPAIVNGTASSTCSYTGSVTSVVIAHIWVQANGKLYDPSFKTYLVQ